MANRTEIGELEISLKMRLEGLEKGIETAKKKLQEMEQENEKIKNSNKGVDASFVAMAAGIIASLSKINGAIKEATQEYKSYTQAMSSLENVSQYTGQSMREFSDIMNKFGKYMTKSDMATTIKNFSLMGMEAKQTEKMMEALTNSAIRNRNANYTVSEAVRVASEGYKQGLSTLSDSAGVTENLSLMLDTYAKSIGKTASQLTEAEKNQAYLARTMEAAAPFASAMSDYTETLAGKEGEYAQAMRETQVAYTEALEPTLIKIEEMKATAIKTIGTLISNTKGLTSGTTAFIAVLGTTVLGITATIKIMQSYKTAIDTLNISTQRLKTTMTGAFAASAIIGSITAIITMINEQKKAQQELTEAQKLHNQVMERTIELNNENVSSAQQTKKDLEDYIKKYEEFQSTQTAVSYADKLIDDGTLHEGMEGFEDFKEKTEELKTELEVMTVELVKQSDSFKKLFKIEKDGILKTNDLTKYLEKYTEVVKKAEIEKDILNILDTKSIKTQQQEAAQAVETAKSYQELFKTYQQGKKGTKAYENAVTELEKKFPEAVNANGIMAQDMKVLIDSMASDAQVSWSNAQNTIQDRINKIEEAIANCDPEIDVNGSYAKSLAQKIGIPTNEIIGTLQTALSLFNMLLDKDSSEVGGGKSSYTPPKVSTGGRSSSGGSKSYQNKKLDNYKELIEYKKSMDQISLKQEIKMYQTALKKYAKTTSEKRELRVKLHELQKELSDAEAERLQKNLDKQVTAVETSVDKKIKAEGAAYDPKERQKDYDKLISVHQKYLDKILKSTKISSDKKKEIYKEELEAIRDYETEKRSLMVESVDNTVSQLTNAITKRLEELEESEKKIVENNIKLVESWKEARINAINEEYNARIDAIQKELDLLDKSEEEKTRAEEDAEYERKRNRLQDLIDFEHDATNRANYQKELDKLVADYQKTLDKRALDDKKETLRAEQDLLKEQQSSLIEATENEADAQKEQYENQITAIEDYYKKQQDNAQKTAEKMLLNVKDNQSQILLLLKNYGDEYEITGQSLGEKLAQGINKGLADKIQSVIQTLQDTIDTNLERKIMGWTGTGSQAISGSNVSSKSVVVNQNNYIQQNPEMPSETYRKLKTIDENLAAQLAGV